MNIDLIKYARNKAAVQREVERGKYADPVDIVNNLGPTIFCPNVVLAFYLAEIIGFTPGIVENINTLIKFNGYLTITGCPNNAPDFGLQKI